MAKKKPAKAFGGNVARRAMQDAAAQIILDRQRWAGFYTVLAGKAGGLLSKADALIGKVTDTPGPSPELEDLTLALNKAVPGAADKTVKFLGELLAPFLSG